jgi:uncharacterized protein YjbI with pentapeptide repeats
MNQDESIALWRKGEEAWNAWAEDMLCQKVELEKEGIWQVDEKFRSEGRNGETRKWIEAARVNLPGLRFMTRALAETAKKQAGQDDGSAQPPEAHVRTLVVESDKISFDGFVFPWLASFRDAQFHGHAAFGDSQFHWVSAFGDTQFTGEACFEGAHFHGQADFWGAKINGKAAFGRTQFHETAVFWDARFHGLADFWGAQFYKEARFWGTQIYGEAAFGRAQFHGKAAFGDTQFHGKARFRGAEFCGWADFGGAQFRRVAGLQEAQFQGQSDFGGASFESSASFQDARFGSKAKPELANFFAIKADRAFDLTGAQFSKVPAFNQADFKQAPDLDNVLFPPRPFWRGGDTKLVPQYRAIKRLAIQGHDYEREQMAFKGELRARRWAIDKWYGPSVWLGMVYDAFADCGRSIWRPFATWAALVLGFAAFYFWRAGEGLAASCGGAPVLQALYLSVKNGLVVFGGTRDARINQAYLCLYGGDGSAVNQAAIPLSVTYAETLLQTPISAVLLFLFLLAVRNQFKIK